jgi:hypothetical protein
VFLIVNFRGDDKYANVLLQQLSFIFNSMDSEKQSSVCKRIMYSGALPIARDTPSFTAIVSVLGAGGFELIFKRRFLFEFI